MTCWACELARGERKQHKTRWYHLTRYVGIVVEDLDSKSYSMRLLYVPDYHVPCGQETVKDRETAGDLLLAVAKACLPGYRVAALELDQHSYKAHWHAQAGLMKR